MFILASLRGCGGGQEAWGGFNYTKPGRGSQSSRNGPFSFSLPFIQQRRLAVFFQGHGRECRPMGEETSRRVADVAAAVAVVARVVATLTQERDGKAVKMKILDF